MKGRARDNENLHWNLLCGESEKQGGMVGVDMWSVRDRTIICIGTVERFKVE